MYMDGGQLDGAELKVNIVLFDNRKRESGGGRSRSRERKVARYTPAFLLLSY